MSFKDWCKGKARCTFSVSSWAVEMSVVAGEKEETLPSENGLVWLVLWQMKG